MHRSIHRPLWLVAAAFIAAQAVPAAASDNGAQPKPQIQRAAHHDVSRPMRDILRDLPPWQPSSEQDRFVIPNRFLKPRNPADAALKDLRTLRQQSLPLGVPAPTVDLSALAQDYTSCGGGCLPPDTNGDVSPTEYIQWVNTSWAVYDKTTGAKTSGPTPGSSFWAGFGGNCQNNNDGDPLVLWDDQAQRWVMSQFVVASNSQCFAISTTADPLGTYNRYEFTFPNFPDYGKIGVWTDESATQNAYVMTTHEFNGNTWMGAAFLAFNRAKMLAGDASAEMVRFPGNLDAYGADPANLEGNVRAPAGACPLIVHFDAATSDYLFWHLCVNWTTPANSTISAAPVRVAAGAPFAPNYASTAQPGTTSVLDSFGTHIMYRASSRAFPVGAPYRVSLAVNHTVLGGSNQGGIKWVQFDMEPAQEYQVAPSDRIFADGFGDVANPPYFDGTPHPLGITVAQEGAYTPDANTRWMGGIAIDGNANLGLGYSVGSSSLAPQIRTTGRRLSDAAGTMRDEQTCTPAGTGSQTSTSGRWGDYASMSVDPSDQCSFWFTSEYQPVTSGAAWSTRICRFKFAECGTADFALVATTPSRIEYCAATDSDPVYGLRAGVLNGFNAAVTLSAVGNPSPTTPSFSVNPISPTPGASALTLGGANGVAAGEYSFRVDGTDGTLTRSLALELGVSTAATAAPTLSAPANGATNVSVYPTLSWSAVTGALEYRVQIASDSGFANIVVNNVVTATSWSAAKPLAAGTYYWRVTPHNYCGDGATSATFSFTTLTPGQCPAGTTLTNLLNDPVSTGGNPNAQPFLAGDGPGTNANGVSDWGRGNAPAGTGLTGGVWSVPDNTASSDKVLTLRTAIALPAGKQAFLSYDTYHSSETDGSAGCWDSASIEVQIGAGAFNYLDFGHMYTDPYEATNSGGAPLEGRQVWCHPSGTPKHSVVKLDDFAGQSIKFRFRATSDSNTAAAAPNGMYVDNVRVDYCQ